MVYSILEKLAIPSAHGCSLIASNRKTCFAHLSNEKTVCLGYIRDYTTQLCGDGNK